MKKKLKSLCTVAWRGLFSGLFLRIGRIVGLLMMGGERVSIARVLLELKLQDEEEQGMEWEPDVMDAYHWLCWLEGIRGYDLLSLSHLEEVERSHLERGLPVRSWIHTRIQRGRCPYLRDTSRDRPSPRARSLWGCLYSFFLENVKVVAPPPMESDGVEIERLKGGCSPTACSPSSIFWEGGEL
jgi:hypothetical protein